MYRHISFFPCTEEGNCCMRAICKGQKVCILDEGECKAQDTSQIIYS